MALYNTGYQAHLAIAAGAAPLDVWQTHAMESMGLLFAPDDWWACLVHGALYFVPVLVVTFAVGGLWKRCSRLSVDTKSTRGSWSPACCSR